MLTINYPGSLHNHSDFSNIRLRDCIVKTPELIDRAIELGHKVVAVTDHEALCNSIKVEKYYTKIKKEHPEFKLIRGNEIYLCRNGLNSENFVRGVDSYYHFILLAKDAIGHEQIRTISTRAWRRSYMARGMRRVPTYYQDLIDVIGTNPGHVIGSTACLAGALPTQILRGTEEERLNIWISQMLQIFGRGNFVFEMQPSKNKEQIVVNKRLLQLARAHDIPYIITTDTHYAKKADRPIHKAYLNSQNGEREVDEFYATTYLMGTEELEGFFEYFDNTILQSAYQNIQNLADSCEDYSLIKPLKIPSLMWKEFPIDVGEYKKYQQLMPTLEKFYTSSFEGDKRLVWAVIDGIKRKTDLQNQEAYAAIEECLDSTWRSSEKNNAHWSAYFLNLQKMIDLCWEAGSLVGPGRGSGVGFILLYVLDLIQINQLREDTKCYPWRFLNPDRVSVLDIDTDIEKERRGQVLQKFREFYGDDRVSNIITFKTETSKNAILTSCRGLNIDVDVASYLSSLIPADRGQIRSLKDCMYGNPEKDFNPITQFVNEMTNNYPEVWEVASKIEGVVCGIGIHAGGVIAVDEPFERNTALMRAPDGTLITAFDLHDCEEASLIKIDLLSIANLDKMHKTLDLLTEYGYIKPRPTLRETYEDIIGVYNLERTAPKMWEMVHNHEIHSLFQMEQVSGIQGISLIKPTSVDELAVLNSVIRLMAPDKNSEQPLNKFARFKQDIRNWYQEMKDYGLTEEEQKVLEPIVGSSYGICESQEKFMQLVQIPQCGGFDLQFADRLRKAIAKKNPADYDKLTKEYFDKTAEKGLSPNLCNYVWNVLIATSKGYGFNALLWRTQA